MQPLKQRVGDIYPTSSGEVVVMEVLNSQKILVKFKNTGYETYCRSGALVNGNVKDYYKPLDIAGYVGGKEFTWSKNKKIYQAWRNMIRRCYDPLSERYVNYGEMGVRVVDSWLNFQNFAKWWISEKEKLPEDLRENLQIDKDFYGDVYSEHTCRLIPNDLNLFLSGNTKNNTHSYWCEGDKYRVRVMLPDGSEGNCLSFDSLSGAECCWVSYRWERAKYLVDKYRDVSYLEDILIQLVRLPIFKRPRYDKDVADNLQEIKDKVRIK